MSTVKIGHALKDERSALKNGNVGDQTGREVFVTDWYLHSKGWVLLRPKSAAAAEKIAKAMEKACKNPDIGYDQNNRHALFDNVKDKNFDPSKTTKKVETVCSALVRVCVAYAYGKDIMGHVTTGDLPKRLVSTKKFKKYTSSKYGKSSNYLKRGDILCTPVPGHVIVVLSDGAKVKKATKKTTGSKTAKNSVAAADYYLKSLAGTYTTTVNLNVRCDAGVSKKKILTLPKNSKVKNFGYYSTVSQTKWLYVQFEFNNKSYSGYCSLKYLKKK